jgi:hypothetical protein
MSTPYMLLVLPVPSTTLGPLWAQEIVDALTAVDSHDHSSGKGAKIGVSGIDIEGDLPVNNNDVTGVRSVRLQSQASTLSDSSDLGCVYNDSGNLYYNNGAGVPVQLTNGTAIAISGSGAFAVKTPSSYPYTVIAEDAQKVLLIDTSSARTINLPAATTSMFFQVKDINGHCGANNISVVPSGTDTIDNVNATYTCYTDFIAQGFISDGVSNWYAI